MRRPSELRVAFSETIDTLLCRFIALVSSPDVTIYTCMC
jgi:hypothetical protein